MNKSKAGEASKRTCIETVSKDVADYKFELQYVLPPSIAAE